MNVISYERFLARRAVKMSGEIGQPPIAPPSARRQIHGSMSGASRDTETLISDRAGEQVASSFNASAEAWLDDNDALEAGVRLMEADYLSEVEDFLDGYRRTDEDGWFYADDQ